MAARSPARFTLGVDYGTNSVRCLVVDARNGRELATSVLAHPSGDYGILLDAGDPNLARQNPADYITGFLTTVRRAVTSAKKVRGFDPSRVNMSLVPIHGRRVRLRRFHLLEGIQGVLDRMINLVRVPSTSLGLG